MTSHDAPARALAKALAKAQAEAAAATAERIVLEHIDGDYMVYSPSALEDAIAAALATSRAGEPEDPPWTPFERAQAIVTLDYRQLRRESGLSKSQAKRLLGQQRRALVWKNSLYQVVIDELNALAGFPMLHLSIRRLDRQPVRDWRHIQRIKNELVGPEHEGAELYPAESRVIDMANQFHLWVFKTPFPESVMPFGWFGPRAVDSRSGWNAVQRPVEEPVSEVSAS